MAVLLTACGTPNATPAPQVSINKQGGAIGCQYFLPKSGDWDPNTCKKVLLGSGFVKPNSENKIKLGGRTRVELNTGEVLWFLDEDVVYSESVHVKYVPTETK